MEQPLSASEGQFVVLAKGNWHWNEGKYRHYRDNTTMGTVNINVTKWTGQSLISIAKFTLDVFPGEPASSGQSIHIPDYLGAVTGNRFCLVYATQKNQRLFVLYEIDESNQKITVMAQFGIESKFAPTAMMAIKDKVFIGFPGQVGYVDLTQPSLSLNMFHTWEEQMWGRSPLKTIDAFAFDSTLSNGELIAIDDFVWPKYAFAYKITGVVPKFVAKFDLPSGVNEQYRHAVKHGDRLVLTAYHFNAGGTGNTICVFDGTRVTYSLFENEPHEESEAKQLLAGDKYTALSSVGLLNGNVILVSAGTRGVIAIPIDQIKIEERPSYYEEFERVTVPHGLRNLHVGTSAAEVVTVKDKSVAFILGTTDTNRTVLNQVRWNEQKKDLEVVHSENIEGVYERLFMEV